MDKKVLHVSDDPLPDARVEKMASSMIKSNAKPYFVGPASSSSALLKTHFKKLFVLDWSPRARMHLPPYWRTIKLSIKRLVDMLKPDLIHAHNIFAARLCSELGLRMVYDSHEHWSQLFKAVRTYRSKPGLINAYLSWLTPRWSKAILDKAPVITVSPTIAQDYRKHGRAFLIPNYPNELEISLMKNRKKPQNKLSCVTVGKDFPARVPFRDTSGLLEALAGCGAVEATLIGPPQAFTDNPKIRSLGYLNHVDLLMGLPRHHVGLIPWKPHWYHKYCSPNKAYQYAHAGLVVVAPYTMEPVIEAIGRDLCLTFRDFQELAEILQDLSRDLKYTLKLGRETREYARERLTWEVYEDAIDEAYESAYA
ncbi:MAG: glycosyltransferase [Candidatus Bathyarchaeia archaeon]